TVCRFRLAIRAKSSWFHPRSSTNRAIFRARSVARTAIWPSIVDHQGKGVLAEGEGHYSTTRRAGPSTEFRRRRLTPGTHRFNRPLLHRLEKRHGLLHRRGDRRLVGPRDLDRL